MTVYTINKPPIWVDCEAGWWQTLFEPRYRFNPLDWEVGIFQIPDGRYVIAAAKNDYLEYGDEYAWKHYVLGHNEYRASYYRSVAEAMDDWYNHSRGDGLRKTRSTLKYAAVVLYRPHETEESIIVRPKVR